MVNPIKLAEELKLLDDMLSKLEGFEERRASKDTPHHECQILDAVISMMREEIGKKLRDINRRLRGS